MPKSKLVIGLDFDNTLVCYDKAMYQMGLELGFISSNVVVGNKEQIRDYIRMLPDGEYKWQILQAEVYGKQMHRARLIDGVEKFLVTCKERGIKPLIVSHKTKYAAQDKARINLQQVALDWMRQHRFFDKHGFGLSEDRVYFEDTRTNKVARIKELSCSHFVDDLREVFAEEGFPCGTVRMLFCPVNVGVADEEVIKVFRSWDDIYNYFFVKTVNQ